MGGYMTQDQVCADWCDLIQPGFAELSFDIVFLGESKAAEGLYARVCCSPACFRSKHFCHVGLGSAGFIIVK